MRYFAARYLFVRRLFCPSSPAEAFVEHHFLAVMRPAFDEGVAAENFLDLRRRRGIQVQELHVMAGVGLVDGNDIGRVIIE